MIPEAYESSFPPHSLRAFRVTILNQMNLLLKSSLTLTVAGPGLYYLYYFQPIEVVTNGVKDHSFNWVAPNVAGTYIVEVGFVPTQLTVYETAWLKVSYLSLFDC